MFARSASDDKSPIIMLLTAVDVLQAQRKTPAINVKVLLDSEEEMGSPQSRRDGESQRRAVQSRRVDRARRSTARLPVNRRSCSAIAASRRRR